jgi:dATP/dGTP diphosphohydrolase
MTDYITRDSGVRAEFSNGGVRDTEAGKPRFDLVMPLNVPYSEQLLTRVAGLMGRGAAKYDDRNWEQFADEAALNRAKSSAFRHFVQWISGEADEDHAAAVFFNIQAAEYVQGVLAGRWPAAQNEESN